MSKINWHTQHKLNLTWVEKAEEAIGSFCGTRTFFLLHVLWFGYWILRPVEPFPYGLLTMIVSLEAILLSTIIMINQRRHDGLAAAQAENDRRVETEKLDAILFHVSATIEQDHTDDKDGISDRVHDGVRKVREELKEKKHAT